jgi:hypothetical protein
MDRPIVFMHVPKAAGATLRRTLVAVYGRERVLHFQPGKRDRYLALLRTMPVDERVSLRIITGHIPYGLVDLDLPQPPSYITVLRDPVERVRSLYQFVRNDPSHPYFPHATGSLTEFASSDINELDNLQTRFVLGGALTGALDERAAELARWRLRTFLAVGVQERYERFVAELSEALGWEHVPQVRNSHVASAKLTVDVEAREIIHERNKFDEALHREAAAIAP